MKNLRKKLILHMSFLIGSLTFGSCAMGMSSLLLPMIGTAVSLPCATAYNAYKLGRLYCRQRDSKGVQDMFAPIKKGLNGLAANPAVASADTLGLVSTSLQSLQSRYPHLEKVDAQYRSFKTSFDTAQGLYTTTNAQRPAAVANSQMDEKHRADDPAVVALKAASLMNAKNAADAFAKAKQDNYDKRKNKMIYRAALTAGFGVMSWLFFKTLSANSRLY